MKIKITDGMARIPNIAFAIGHEKQLSPDELMVFAHLQFLKQHGTKNTYTTIDMLLDTLDWRTKGNNSSRDRSKISNVLYSLESKNYLKLNFEGKINSATLNISINHSLKEEVITVSVDFKNTPMTFKGFTKIEANHYNLAKGDAYILTVVAYVAWRKGLKNYKISFREWEGILQVTDKTARKVLCEKCKGIINVKSGKYIENDSTIRQEPNTYSIIDIPKDIHHDNENKQMPLPVQKIVNQITDLKIKNNSDIAMQLFDKNTYIKLNGYKALMESPCEYAKQEGQKKIEKMRENKNGAKAVERLEKDYNAYKENIERQDIAIEATPIIENYIPSFKEKEGKNKNIFNDDPNAYNVKPDSGFDFDIEVDSDIFDFS